MIVTENGSMVGRLRIGEGVIVKEQHRLFFLIVKGEFCILIIMWLHKLICVIMFHRTEQ